jgi:DNA (cytosine-5)-methyltransferase 1
MAGILDHKIQTFTALDFFAGSGLVTHSLKPFFNVIWANDVSQQKAEVYVNNHGSSHFQLEDIGNIDGGCLPHVDLSWASFPCQDLSLAGKGEGIHANRSGLVWQWLRIMDEMEQAPDILTAENVEGLISADAGANYIVLHNELVQRGYRVGAIKLNAQKWIPQSRPRIFIIAVKRDIALPYKLESQNPNWLHSDNIMRAATGLRQWIWWNMPEPLERQRQLSDIIEWDAPVDTIEKTNYLLSLLSEKHKKLLDENDDIALTGYKRTRDGKQRLEIRFDGVAGCLRTPKGGSSRQILVLKRNGEIHTRLLTARETARLMGAPDGYWLPEKYNDAYMAMGDAVAVPAVHYLAEYLLFPLATQAKFQRIKERKEQHDATRAVVGI